MADPLSSLQEARVYAEEIRDNTGPDRVMEVRRARMWERGPSWTRYERKLSKALLAALERQGELEKALWQIVKGIRYELDWVDVARAALRGEPGHTDG